jgi:hydrocephalus-inducing protein
VQQVALRLLTADFHTGTCCCPVLCCRNVSKLPLQFTVKATSPFSVEPSALSLQPGESAPLVFSFDPDFRHDLVSQSIKQRCLISYPDNPQKDWLELSGIIDFPNLLFDATCVDFGCVLMDSMRRVSVGMSNPGRVPVEYNWSWLSQPGLDAGD